MEESLRRVWYCDRKIKSQSRKLISIPNPICSVNTIDFLRSNCMRSILFLQSGEVRKIYHVNYIGWVDHGVPVSASSLLNFVREVVKLEQRTGNGLTLVHCR